MKSCVYHLQLNVSNASVSLPFYRDMLTYLDYKIIDESKDHLGASNGTVDFWIIQTDKKHAKQMYHRKSTGLNHVAFKVSSKADVDLFCKEFLAKHKVTVLYGGAKEYPDYGEGYYAVFFEDHDRIKLEVACKPISKFTHFSEWIFNNTGFVEYWAGKYAGYERTK